MIVIGLGNSWSQTVNKAGSAVSDIGKVKKIQFSKTDLQPFKQFEEIITDVNKSLSDFKSFNKQDTAKMLKVGDKIVEHDKDSAKNMMIAKGV